MDANDNNELPTGGDEVVPGTQFSQDQDDDNNDNDDEVGAEELPSRSLFHTPAKGAAGGNDDDDEYDDEEEVTATPAARGAAPRQLGQRETDMAEEILSSVRKPRQDGVTGGDDDDNDDEDAEDLRSRGGSVMSMLSGNRSRNTRNTNAAAGDGNGEDGAGEDDNNANSNNQEGANNDTEEDPATLIRGTDVHVQSAAAAFRDFVRNFVSVEESERQMAKEVRRKSKRRRRALAAAGGAGGGGGGGDDDDNDGDDTMGESRGENSWDLPSDSEDENEEQEPKRPIYLQKLEQILLRGASDASADSLTSSAASAGTGRVGVASLDLDALHLHYHTGECQRLYGWLVDYPSEIVPLMDILLGRELESLRDNLRLQQEEALGEAEMNGDEEGIETAQGILELLPEVLPRIQVRPFHLRNLSHMRSLDPNAIDTMLSIRGMVVRTSPVIPDLKVAFFQCSICGNADQVTIDRGRIAEPTQCPTCHVRHGYSLIHNRCYYSDKQMVRVQETPDEVPAGETPASIVIFAYDDLVDAVRPGDRVEATGVFRAQARRVNPKITKVKSVYKTYVDAIHFRKVVNNSSKERDAAAAVETAKQRKNNDDGAEKETQQNQQPGKGLRSDEVTHSSNYTPERIAELEALSKQPDVYDQLVKALAPSIWEMDNVKKGVLCMLFGGNSRKVKKGTAQRRKNRVKAREAAKQARRDGMLDDMDVDMEEEPELEEDEDLGDEADDHHKLNKRGDINILLVGDPGTSKSQLLGYVHKLSPRGVYTSGKGSSAVGLTASVVRDPETKELVMESGALVLSDLGICCIDEFVSTHDLLCFL